MPKSFPGHHDPQLLDSEDSQPDPGSPTPCRGSAGAAELLLSYRTLLVTQLTSVLAGRNSTNLAQHLGTGHSAKVLLCWAQMLLSEIIVMSKCFKWLAETSSDLWAGTHARTVENTGLEPQAPWASVSSSLKWANNAYYRDPVQSKLTRTGATGSRHMLRSFPAPLRPASTTGNTESAPGGSLPPPGAPKFTLGPPPSHPVPCRLGSTYWGKTGP